MKDQELQQLYDDGYTAFEQKKYTECADKILAFLHEIGVENARAAAGRRRRVCGNKRCRQRQGLRDG